MKLNSPKFVSMDLCCLSNILTQKILIPGPPGEPQGLKVSNFVPNNDPRISLDSRSVLLTWMSEVDHGSPVTYYSVEFKTSFNNQWTLASALMGFNSGKP